MTIGEKIKTLRKQHNMTQGDVAAALGIATQTVFKYEKNIVTSIPLDNVEKLANLFEVSPSYLTGWQDDESEGTTNYEPTITEDYTTFPVLGDVAAGYDIAAFEDWEGDTIDIPNSYLKGREKTDFFVLRVRGDSMYPTYQEDDKVLVLKQTTVNYSGQVGVVLYEDTQATLKKVEYIIGENWLKLIPINPSHPPKLIKDEALEHCRILGIPTLLIREINNL